jgi:hypothetical protein
LLRILLVEISKAFKWIPLSILLIAAFLLWILSHVVIFFLFPLVSEDVIWCCDFFESFWCLSIVFVWMELLSKLIILNFDIFFSCWLAYS